MTFTYESEVPWWTSCRLGLAIVGFFGFVHLYAQRVGMSIAIVSMVNHTALAEMAAMTSSVNLTHQMSLVNYTNGAAEELQCSDPAFTDSSKSSQPDGEFTWEKSIQGHVLGSFFYGYLVSQVPAGMLAERFGGKWVMAIFFGMTTLATLLSPLAARLGGYAFLIVLRVIAGIGSGAAYPAMHAIWSQWAPPNERSKLTNLTYAGSWMGNVIAMPLAGLLCTYGFDGGWPSVFYLFGLSSVVWIIVWCVVVADAPVKHPRITTVEKAYITESLKGQVSAHGNKTEKMPWFKILTSLPVWAIIMGVVTTDWGLYTFFTNTPTYLYEVLKFDVTSNGLYSALPFLGLWINMNISPVIADRLITSKILSIGNTRRVMQAVGSVGAACFIVGLAFMDCRHPLIAIGLLTTGITITGCVYSGWMVNPMDIAPRYAGTILGLANGLAASTGFIAPYTVAALTPNRTAHEWRRVFFVSGAIYVFGAIFYAIFSSGEIQDWAKEEDEDIEDGEKEELKDLTATPTAGETEPV